MFSIKIVKPSIKFHINFSFHSNEIFISLKLTLSYKEYHTVDSYVRVEIFEVYKFSWISRYASYPQKLIHKPYSRKVWQGEFLVNLFFSSIWRKKVWRINTSAKGLLMVTTISDGFSLELQAIRQIRQAFPHTVLSKSDNNCTYQSMQPCMATKINTSRIFLPFKKMKN